MSRVIEGTTLGGFKCDAAGCDAVAVYAPCVQVPYEGVPIFVRAPIMCLVDTHVCVRHWRPVEAEQMLSKGGKEAVEQCAHDHGGKPDFKRAYLRPVRCHSPEFLEFQQTRGLVPSDDALVKDPIDGI